MPSGGGVHSIGLATLEWLKPARRTPAKRSSAPARNGEQRGVLSKLFGLLVVSFTDVRAALRALSLKGGASDPAAS